MPRHRGKQISAASFRIQWVASVFVGVYFTQTKQAVGTERGRALLDGQAWIGWRIDIRLAEWTTYIAHFDRKGLANFTGRVRLGEPVE